MKKVILLFVAVMISSVLWAQNQYADATVKQLGDNNKAFVDQRGAYGGGWFYDAGSGTDATIKVHGDKNNTAIQQFGEKNVAGQDIRVGGSACDGFYASLVGAKFSESVSIKLCKVKLACCEKVGGGSFEIDSKSLFPGIYVTGDKNKASIYQDGTKNLAGIKIVGDHNKAGVKQVGEENMASLKIKGDHNTSLIEQQGENGGMNLAIVKLNGDHNKSTIYQRGWNNEVAQKVKGDRNIVSASQIGWYDGVYGGGNLAIQKVVGNDNALLLDQQGPGNKSVQITTDNMNNSWVVQHGSNNQSLVRQ